jgi:hypothetical protein
MESLARIPHAVAHMLHQQAPCHCVQLGAFFHVSGARAVGGGRSTFHRLTATLSSLIYEVLEKENNCSLAPAVLQFCWAVLAPPYHAWASYSAVGGVRTPWASLGASQGSHPSHYPGQDIMP